MLQERRESRSPAAGKWPARSTAPTSTRVPRPHRALQRPSIQADRFAIPSNQTVRHDIAWCLSGSGFAGRVWSHAATAHHAPWGPPAGLTRGRAGHSLKSRRRSPRICRSRMLPRTLPLWTSPPSTTPRRRPTPPSKTAQLSLAGRGTARGGGCASSSALRCCSCQ